VTTSRHQAVVRDQLTWEAHVVEYVNCVERDPHYWASLCPPHIPLFTRSITTTLGSVRIVHRQMSVGMDGRRLVIERYTESKKKPGNHGGEGSFCYATTNPLFWERWHHASLGTIPHFFKRCAMTRELLDLVIELRPSHTSMGLAENIKREMMSSGARL